MDEDSETVAEAVAKRNENYPIDLNLHPVNSFSVGWNLGRLQGQIFGQLLNDHKITAEEVANILYETELLSYDSEEDFSITDALDESLNEVTDYYSPEEEVSPSDLEEILEKLGEWKEDYTSEIGDMDFARVVDKGLVDTRELYRNPKMIFDEDVWEWLDEKPREDIQDACQTLVLDMPTASIFLSLRTVEYCLRNWYFEKTGEEIERTSWGGVADKIESEFDDQTREPPVLSNLDYLRNKRNGIAHPDRSPSWEEAEDTLFTVRRTITEIHKELS